MDGIPAIHKQLTYGEYQYLFKLSVTDMALSSDNVRLSHGSLQKILDGIDVDSVTLQILGYKRIPGEGIERFRLLLNDGTLVFSFAILATNLNSLVKDGKLEKYSVFKLDQYVCTLAQPNKKVIICSDITPLIPGCQINIQINYLNSERDHNIVVHNNDVASCSNAYQILTKNDQVSNAILINNSNQSATGNSKTSTLSTSVATKVVIPTCNRYSNSTDNNNQSAIVRNNNSSPALLTSALYPTTSKISHSASNNVASNSNWDRSAVAPTLNVGSKKPVVPIISLTPYQNKWTIKARVIYKTRVSSYSNDKRSGKLFSFCLLDDSGEIKVTAFDRQAEELFQFLQLNDTYYISGANVRLSRMNSSIHDFELTVSDYTKIEPVSNDDSETPEITFNFRAISQIVEEKKNFVDVIGICVGAETRNIIVKATNKEIQKLDMQLMDIDRNIIIVSIWGNEAENCNFDDYPVVAFKRAKVTDFNGCSLSLSPSSMMFINPKLTQAHLLKTWFNEHRSSLQLDISANMFERNQVWKTVADINDLDISNPNVTEYSTVKATIVMVQKDNAMYQACPSSDCFKKVTQTVSGQYHCNKCDKDYDTYSWTLMLRINLADFSSGIWGVAFRETAESLLNLKTADLSALKEQSEDKFQDTLSSLHFKSFIFKLRSKVEVFNDTNQLKTSILDSKPIDTISYTKKLLLDINRLEKMLSTDK